MEIQQGYNPIGKCYLPSAVLWARFWQGNQVTKPSCCKRRISSMVTKIHPSEKLCLVELILNFILRINLLLF